MKPVELEFHVGHYGDGTGAYGIVDEVQYARKFIKGIYDICVANKVPATYYEDKVSKNQTQNINNLIQHHNADNNAIIVSGHLNAVAGVTERAIGAEVLYHSEKALAQNVVSAICNASGLKNRGVQQRKDLGVLARTYEPAILIEFGFVNSRADVALMDKHFEAICFNVAKVLAAAIGKTIKEPVEQPPKKEESKVVQQLLNDTGREEIRALLKKARDKGIIDVKRHTDAKINEYTDMQLINYQAAVINRTFK